MPMRLQRRGDSMERVGVDIGPPLPPHASAGRRWRFRRNLVIYVAHRQGLSQRLLAEVFDLPRSRIAEILAEFRRYDKEGPGDGTGPFDRNGPSLNEMPPAESSP